MYNLEDHSVSFHEFFVRQKKYEDFVIFGRLNQIRHWIFKPNDSPYWKLGPLQCQTLLILFLFLQTQFGKKFGMPAGFT